MKSHLGNGESELDTFSKIAKWHLNFPETLAEAFDLLYKVSLAYLVFSLTIVLGGNTRIFHMLALILIVPDENTRLGSQGPNSVKCHPWFDGIDWKRIADCSFPVPHEITYQIAQHLELPWVLWLRT